MARAALRRRVEKLEATMLETTAASTPLSDDGLVQATRSRTLRLSDVDDVFEDAEAYLRGHVLASAMGHRLERFFDLEGVTWHVRGVGGPITVGANVAGFEPHEEPYFALDFNVDEGWRSFDRRFQSHGYQRWVRTRLMENLFDGDPLARTWRAEIDAWWHDEIEPPGLWPTYDPYADALLTALDDNQLWDVGPPFIMPPRPDDPAGQPEHATHQRWESTETGFTTRGAITYIEADGPGSREFVWPIPEGVTTRHLRIPPLHTPATPASSATTEVNDDD